MNTEAGNPPQTETADLGRAWVVAVLAIVMAGVIAILAWVGGGSASAHAPIRAPAGQTEILDFDEPGTISLPPPELTSEEALDSMEETGKPCSGCHDEDLETNPERRDLEDAHEGIVLRHDEKHRWCLDCHDADNRDKLRLASGTLVDFSESYRLCGQCHGAKYRDWRTGIHGRRVGHWDDTRGPKEYLLCVHCHDSHAPAFKPIQPKPPPLAPGDLR